MKGLPEFRLSRPESIADAVAARGAEPDARFLAGGTDLIPNLGRDLGTPSMLIDLARIPELGALEVTADGGLRIGAGVTLARLAAEPAVVERFAAIARAAASVAGPTHRVRATVGGNLCLDTRCLYYNESDWWRSGQGYCLKYGGEKCHVVIKSDRCYAVYSGDLAPALLVLGTEVELAGPDGSRSLALTEFYREDGKTPLAMLPQELIVAVHVPPPRGLRTTYEKVRARDAIDFPVVGVACALERAGDRLRTLRLAYTGTNSCPVLVRGLEERIDAPLDDDLIRELSEFAEKQLAPLRTTTTAPRYRRRAARLLTGQAISRLAG
ncbi:MAG TPA: 4-hydroxybenzoyl-CoA reductase subunit beta [Gammaproteobacteria bacterium]|nr:4-hydroxybenzoyl-CoA reductase subunit beta [Gammaproteobacteria bacterium]